MRVLWCIVLSVTLVLRSRAQPLAAARVAAFANALPGSRGRAQLASVGRRVHFVLHLFSFFYSVLSISIH